MSKISSGIQNHFHFIIQNLNNSILVGGEHVPDPNKQAHQYGMPREYLDVHPDGECLFISTY